MTLIVLLVWTWSVSCRCLCQGWTLYKKAWQGHKGRLTW